MTRVVPTVRRAALPRSSERLVPWLAAALVVGGLNAALLWTGGSRGADGALLVLGLAATLAVAGMVAARAASAVRAVDREERHRPSLDELFAADEAFGGPAVPPAVRYFDGMERWTAAMLELTEHALAAPDAPAEKVAELDAAAAATRELHALLQSTAGAPVDINGMATVHGVCSTWEADQLRVEQLSASVDGAWYARWNARTVTERRLRRGGRPATTMVLPYRS